MFLINRDLAMTVLANEPLGSFMVRKSETQPGTLALSVRVPKTFHPLGITHYIIIRVETGYQIKVRNSQHGVSMVSGQSARTINVKFISFGLLHNSVQSKFIYFISTIDSFISNRFSISTYNTFYSHQMTKTIYFVGDLLNAVSSCHLTMFYTAHLH